MSLFYIRENLVPEKLSNKSKAIQNPSYHKNQKNLDSQASVLVYPIAQKFILTSLLHYLSGQASD